MNNSISHTITTIKLQIRQAELEQNNMELSIGITERQREISRLKIQMEQVAVNNLPANALDSTSHLSYSPCISFHQLFFQSSRYPFIPPALCFTHVASIIFSYFQDGREDGEANIREVSTPIVAVITKRRNLPFFQKIFWKQSLKTTNISRFSSTKSKNLAFCFDFNNICPFPLHFKSWTLHQ